MEANVRKPWALRSFAPLLPILIVFLGVGLAYNASVPLLEAPDEPSHVAFIRYLDATHALPVQRPPGFFPVGQEGSQPPLYYLVGATLFGLAPGPALAPTFDAHNPFVTFDRSWAVPGNRNLYAHTADERYPFRGDVLGIHLARLASALFGAITVLFTFLIARDLFPRRLLVAPLAAALVAFNPQFAFISGVVNNDGAIAALGTLALWCLVRWSIRGGSTRLAVVLGLGLAAATLAKTDGLLLVPFVALALLPDLVRRKSRGLALRQAVVVGGLAGALAGWWFARNQVVYGDPLGWGAMLAANSSMLRRPSIGAWDAVQVLWRARGTFWGAFGWTNVLYPEQVYRALDVAVAACAVGLLIGVWRRVMRRVGHVAVDRTGDSPARADTPTRRWSPDVEIRRLVALGILALWPIAVFASLVRWVEVNAAADQWRLLLAAIAPIGLFLALGIDEWRLAFAALTRLTRAGCRDVGAGLERKDQLAASVAAGVGLALIGGAINAIVISRVIVPAFYPTTTAAAGSPTVAPIRFGAGAMLEGYRVRPTRLASGQTLEIDLTWRALRPIQRNYAVSIGLVGADNTVLAKVQTWPQAGRAPTSGWQPGDSYPDRYLLDPRWTSDQPQIASVWLNLYDASVLGGPSLPVTDSSGHAAGNGVVLARVKLSPTRPIVTRPSHAVGAHFGGAIDLVGYDETVTAHDLQVTLYWKDVGPIADAETVFVHLARDDGYVVAQHDGPPRAGTYPTTAWDPGDVVLDQHVIRLDGVPPGTYQVLVGLYRPDTGTRLHALAAGGVPAPDDALRLFDLRVPSVSR